MPHAALMTNGDREPMMRCRDAASIEDHAVAQLVLGGTAVVYRSRWIWRWATGRPEPSVCAHTPVRCLTPSNSVNQPMSDSHSQRGSPDDQFINIDDGDEVRHWTRLLHTTADQLKDAVIKVGNSGEKVRQYLQKPSRD